MKKLFFIIPLLLTEFDAHAQTPGSLDLTFGETGYVTTSLGKSDNYGRAVTIQTDGKIVVAGYSSDNSDFDFALVRYNTDGTLDNFFGTAGKVTTSIGSSDDEAFAAVIQSDGKIVLAGFTTATFGGHNSALTRYKTNGTLDSTFGKNGIVINHTGTNDDEINAVTLQSDGKIVVAGYSYDSLNADFAIARYNVDGTLDNSFGKKGTIISPLGISDDKAFAIAIQTDGKVVAAGYSANGPDINFAVVRYYSNGTLDSSFGKYGIAMTPFENGFNYANALAIQTDGKIVVTGYSYNLSNNDFLIARYNPNGTLDYSFGKNGIVITPVGAYNDEAAAVTIQTDGRIITVGYSANESYIDFAVTRYNVNGTLDYSFGNEGIVKTPIGSTYDYARALAIQTDGRIVVAGYTNNDSDKKDFAVARYIGILR